MQRKRINTHIEYISKESLRCHLAPLKHIKLTNISSFSLYFQIILSPSNIKSSSSLSDVAFSDGPITETSRYLVKIPARYCSCSSPSSVFVKKKNPLFVDAACPYTYSTAAAPSSPAASLLSPPNTPPSHFFLTILITTKSNFCYTLLYILIHIYIHKLLLIKTKEIMKMKKKI